MSQVKNLKDLYEKFRFATAALNKKDLSFQNI